MKLQSDTREIQERLGNYCKTGKEVTLPGVTPNRLHHYRRLVYNVVKNTMDQAYPIASSGLDEEIWDSLVNDFFSNHPTQSAQVWKLPYEFYAYHFSNHSGAQFEKPWLNDLLYFEWAEIEVHTMPDVQPEPYVAEGDPLEDRIVLNPEHQVLQLEYPVHLHALEGMEDRKGQYYALLFREPQTGRVRFIQLSMFHAFLILKIAETGDQVNSFKGELAGIAAVESEKFLDDSLVSFIRDLKDRQMVLGFRKE